MRARRIWRGRFGAAAAVAVVLSATAFSRADADEIDRIVGVFMAGQDIPGAAVYVRRDGETIKQKGYGLANLETGSRVDARSLFQSGSLGKQFTAVAVALLAEEGKLQLHEDVRSYLPDAPERFTRMTISHLLSHTSGLSSYPSTIDFQVNYTDDELLRLIYEEPAVCDPGTCFEYSNSGYIILGYLIERVTGRFYGKYLADRIFEPLGMGSAQVIKPKRILPGRVDGYERRDGQLENASWASPAVSTTADGSLYISIEDYARWDTALAGRRILPARTWDRLWTPVRLSNGEVNPDNYGYGWYVHESEMGRYVDHSGDWQGFHCYAMRFVDRDIAVAVMTNLSPAGGTRPREMAHAILESVVDADAPVGRMDVGKIDDKRPDLTSRHRRAFDNGVDLRRESLRWSDGAMSRERARYLGNVQADLERAGSLNDFYLSASEVDDGTVLRTYVAIYENIVYTARFRLSSDEEVLAIRVLPEPRPIVGYGVGL